MTNHVDGNTLKCHTVKVIYLLFKLCGHQSVRNFVRNALALVALVAACVRVYVYLRIRFDFGRCSLHARLSQMMFQLQLRSKQFEMNEKIVCALRALANDMAARSLARSIGWLAGYKEEQTTVMVALYRKAKMEWYVCAVRAGFLA